MNIEPDVFDINPHFKMEVDFVGHGRHKVVTADHFYKFPDRVLKLALELPYTGRFEIVWKFSGGPRICQRGH